MKQLLTLSILLACAIVCHATPETITGPDGQLKLSIDVKDGRAVYSVTYNNKVMLLDSPLGFKSNEADFDSGLEFVAAERSEVKDTYTLPQGKRNKVEYVANQITYKVKNNKGLTINIVFQVSNNDIAFRYELPKFNNRASIRIFNEETGFRFPESTTTFLTPQSHAMIGWQRSKPSYEENYSYDAPMTERSGYGHGYTFPCLYKIGEDGWVLVSETGVDSRYCASRLSDCKEGNLYTVEFPMPEENNGNGTVEPAFSLPGATPWRTITVGSTLKPIVETTASWNTVKPYYEAETQYKYVKSTWSWIVWQDASMNWNDQVAYINLASTLGYQYILIDAGWDKEIGYDKMEKLVKLAKSKSVEVFLWWSSSGYWNDIFQSPINCMDNSIVRKKSMRWMKKIGIKGIKVDFWGGDKQETMRMYEEVLSDANDNELMVIFHGCTIPRGWERMYPNYVGSEAVLASENMVFSQGFCDIEAQNTATHPFIRNAIGCMEWGGSFLNRRIGRGNTRGNVRKTTDCHELAQAVLFQNPIQNFALTPENLRPFDEGGAPEVSIDFMKNVPTTWCETKFIAGYPGKYVVLARQDMNGKWYIAGNNAEKATKEMVLDLSGVLSKGDVVTLYSDDKAREPHKNEMKIKDPRKVKLTVLSDGGFVIVK
ncbi:MAG: glycoside hydrolase family 97 catalytic domain-containing protein [Prevotellaceae bacterium]|nr:glycoside hydrolase family 97 catalytic domain-containing protein [Prevotellaceae bacterium]